MATRDEILANWETEGIDTEWCAIDSYDSETGVIRRLFVGEEAETLKIMTSYYANIAELSMQPFYRASYIPASDALAYFKGEVDELPDERGAYTVTEAAGILDISRQRVHQLIKEGKLEGRKVGKTWYLYRFSVEARAAEMGQAQHGGAE